MFVGKMILELRAEWCRTLKERRMVARSMVGKIRSHFNVAVLEMEVTEYQKITLGIACLGHHPADIEATMERIIHFAEDNTDAVLTDITKEIF